jgi:hypothetical protein
MLTAGLARRLGGALLAAGRRTFAAEAAPAAAAASDMGYVAQVRNEAERRA